MADAAPGSALPQPDPRPSPAASPPPGSPPPASTPATPAAGAPPLRSGPARVLRVVLSVLSALLLLAGLGAGAVYFRSERRAKTKARVFTAPTSPELVARGRYLASIDCALCHGQDLSGGEEFALPIVRSWASNVTQDKATGIGGWTDGQLEEALRRGVRPDGRILRPPMPVFKGLSDEDMAAVIAYLKTVAPVAKPSRLPELTILGRVVYAFAKHPIHNVVTGVVAPPQGPTKEYGRYLAEEVVRCADCHHPRVKNVPVAGKLWSGGMRFEVPTPVLAANITPDEVEGIGKWSRAQLIHAVRDGINPAGRTLHPVMPRYPLADADAEALDAFLRSVDPVRVHVYSPEALHGSELYVAKGCVSCHGLDGRGPRADLTKLGSAADVAKLKAWIQDPESQKPGTQMPKLGITDERELDALARFVVEMSRQGS